MRRACRPSGYEPDELPLLYPVGTAGKIIDYQLNAPFVYVRCFVQHLFTSGNGKAGLEHVPLGTQKSHLIDGSFLDLRSASRDFAPSFRDHRRILLPSCVYPRRSDSRSTICIPACQAPAVCCSHLPAQTPFVILYNLSFPIFGYRQQYHRQIPSHNHRESSVREPGRRAMQGKG